MVAGILAAGLCVALFILAGHPPAAAVGAVWVAILGAGWMLGRPPRPSRRERRREVLDRRWRQAALEAIVDEAREELDGTNVLVPVIKNAPRRVA